MTNLIVAKRYARALLELGKEDGKFEQYGREVLEFVGILNQSPELEPALGNPAFAFEGRKNLLDAILAKAGLSPLVNNFFKLLMDRGRIGAVRAINEVYQQFIDEVKGITRAEVVSAAGLNDAEIQRLSATLKEVAGREVKLEVKEDPSLIGGVVARIGDLVLDGSLRTQLESLKDSLRRGEYA
ncbi:MAG: F0F1 ATP synthase subunit delta [Desulfarculus sp.]|nr:F0F1 ATP synthase subunit delta [Desulfarculus sp.]